MSELMSRNPIITSIYTADPAPMVYEDTLYLYTTHDEDKLINDFPDLVAEHHANKEMTSLFLCKFIILT